jgi:hypothetical protein
MPTIIVMANAELSVEEAITMEELVTVENVQGSFFAEQLAERIAWAVEDAHRRELETTCS